MSMPRKGTRRIVVEGHAYRWSAMHPKAEPHLQSVWVEREGAGGQRLHSDFEVFFLLAAGSETTGLAVPPDVVRRLVVAALASGWKPDARGLPPFVLDCSAIVPTRPIEVEGRGYQWLVHADPARRRLVVSVEPDDRGGQRLVASIEATWDGLGAPNARALDMVTPGLVRRLALAALARGWTPAVHGLPPLEIEYP